MASRLFQSILAPISLDRLQYYRCWALLDFRKGHSLIYGFYVMTINCNDVPLKAFKSGLKVAYAIYILNRAIYLEFIMVDKRHQVRQPVLGSRHYRFPNLTFLNLTIA